MSFPDLASLDDLEVRLNRNLTPDQQGLAAQFLSDASAAVRLYTGQTFTQVVDDVVRLKFRNGKVRLPQRPVTAVTAVTATAWDGSETPVLWRWWDGLQDVTVFPNVPNFFAFEPFRTDVTNVTVTYTHGYEADELPPALVGIVVQVVGRALGTDVIQTGITQESIGGYSYSLGAAAAAGGFGLLPAEKDMLDVFRRVGGAVTVGP